MIRPHWRSAMFTAVSGGLALAMLAGCTTRYSGNASDETARYLQNARGRYVIPGPPSDPWGPYVREASRRFDMPEPWIRALMRQESGGNLYRNGRLITSSAGAMGLMQVMPGTYRELRARHNLGYDPFDPHDNIMAGVGYMREMYDMYGAPGFLAAYNAGPNRLDDYLANQRGLPDETRHYVASIGPYLRTTAPRVRSPAEQYAMNQLPLSIPPGPRYGYGSPPPAVATVQLASATTTYKPPVFTQAPVQPVYSPAPQPRVLAYAAPPPRPVYTPAPAAQPPAAQPPAVAWTPAPQVPAAAPPPQRTAVASVVEEEEDEPAPVRRNRARAPVQHVNVAHVAPAAAPTRVALAMHPTPAQRRGGGLHLISTAMAAEAYPVRHGPKAYPIPVSYTKPAHARPISSTWKLHASGPLQAAPVCHKNKLGKMICGPDRL